MLTRPKAILFDWDNTLVDTWPCIGWATNLTRAAMGLAPWTEAEMRVNIAGSLRDTFPRIYGDRWEQAREIYHRNFAATHLEMLQPNPAAEDLLQFAHQAGIYLGVVSNKNGTALRREADHLGWSKHFGRVVGATDAKRDKPAPDPVIMALEPAGLTPDSTVWFIGDTGIDMECAYAAGCVPVLVTAKEIDFAEFQAFPPKIAVPDLNRLGAMLRDL